jgi:hypothetical protein
MGLKDQIGERLNEAHKQERDGGTKLGVNQLPEAFVEEHKALMDIVVWLADAVEKLQDDSSYPKYISIT